MSNNRFSNIHLGLSQAEAIRILGSPIEQLDSNSDYYMAAAHLLNFPGLESESALLKLLASTDNSQPIKLAQRKAVEVLGLLGCQDCLPLLFDFLSSDDPYLVENTAWALKQLNCQDKATISRLIELLYLPGQNYRIIIQALSGLGALDSVEAIRCHLNSDNSAVQGAALAGLAILVKEDQDLSILKEHLILPNQMDRQSAIQDIIDSKAYNLLPQVLSAPVSPVFKMRAVRALWPINLPEIAGKSLYNCLDDLIKDEYSVVNIVHCYDEPPAIDFLIQEFFGTDFSRCYLALKTLANRNFDDIWPILLDRWITDAFNDYGAHYFFIRLMGQAREWKVEYQTKAIEILLEAIVNPRPQFLKSKPAAILALAEVAPQLTAQRTVQWLDPVATLFWEARYASLLAWELLESKSLNILPLDELQVICSTDSELYIRNRALRFSS